MIPPSYIIECKTEDIFSFLRDNKSLFPLLLSSEIIDSVIEKIPSNYIIGCFYDNNRLIRAEFRFNFGSIKDKLGIVLGYSTSSGNMLSYSVEGLKDGRERLEFTYSIKDRSLEQRYDKWGNAKEVGYFDTSGKIIAWYDNFEEECYEEFIDDSICEKDFYYIAKIAYLDEAGNLVREYSNTDHPVIIKSAQKRRTSGLSGFHENSILDQDRIASYETYYHVIKKEIHYSDTDIVVEEYYSEGYM